MAQDHGHPRPGTEVAVRPGGNSQMGYTVLVRKTQREGRHREWSVGSAPPDQHSGSRQIYQKHFHSSFALHPAFQFSRLASTARTVYHKGYDIALLSVGEVPTCLPCPVATRVCRLGGLVFVHSATRDIHGATPRQLCCLLNFPPFPSRATWRIAFPCPRRNRLRIDVPF